MKKIILIVCLTLIAWESFGQSTWFRFYGGAFFDNAWSVVLTKDNNILVVEERFNYFPDTYYRTYLTKFNLAGNLLWQKYFDSTQTYSASEDNSGNLYLRFFKDIYKLNPNGNILWTRQFPDTLHIPQYACKFTSDIGI